MRLRSKHSFVSKLSVVLLLLTVLYSCRKTDNSPASPTEENAQVVYEWYKYMADLQRPLPSFPAVFVQLRAYAYIGLGLFESVQPGIKDGSSFSTKLYEMPAMPKPDMSKEYLWSASANAALASMFKQFLKGSLSSTDIDKLNEKEAAIYNQLKLTTPEDVLKRSEAFGRSIAQAIYDWSATDNFFVSSPIYTPINEPWAWQPTPPSNAAAVGDLIQYSRPFLEYSKDATAPPLPIPYSEDPTSDFYEATKEVYDIGGTTTATSANKATANWWADAGGPGIALPAPYHILSIITTVLESQNSRLWKAAEVYAKTGIALKDGQIITFRAKYQYNLLRPITYIRRHIDPTWSSHLTNPPYPDYTSGLMSFYAPVIQVLINEFGDIPVTDNAYAWRSLPARSFTSLSQLREEASESRCFAGIHYRFTQDVSVQMGIKLGNEIDKINVVGP